MKIPIKTPIINYHADPKILLKAENLQPFGSYKIRGVQNFFSHRLHDLKERGLVLASAGNMAQPVAYFAREFGIKCTIYIPSSAPEKKKQALYDLGANILEKPFEQIWNLVTQDYSGREIFLHPARTKELVAGYETIVQEILNEHSDIESIVVPFGVGGLITGIAQAAKKLAPKLKIVAAEIETAATLSMSMAAGKPRKINRSASFVDAIGTPEVLTDVFENIHSSIYKSVVIPVSEAKNTVYDLVKHHALVVEGAGATAVAAAKIFQNNGESTGKTVAILTGGNIDLESLSS